MTSDIKTTSNQQKVCEARRDPTAIRRTSFSPLTMRLRSSRHLFSCSGDIQWIVCCGHRDKMETVKNYSKRGEDMMHMSGVKA
ncbi:hypothetical protein RRG08_039303 [Elysia crispata]|uniref:Uncharacterized protein n=1 Tax=Elysia crispata TaxID=231223 RepID=A0AAE0Z763_9GAST|nr:hypothetical protein RRG08_039303 [Elysia crispata]